MWLESNFLHCFLPDKHLPEDTCFELKQVYMALAYRYCPVNKGNWDTRQVDRSVYQAKVMKTLARASRLTVCQSTGIFTPNRLTA